MTQPIAILGRGQLGWMLRRAGDRIGANVQLLDPQAPEQPAPDTLITVESEHWPDNEGTRALRQHPGWQNAKTLDTLPSRILQKTLLDELQLPTAPWCRPKVSDSAEDVHNTLGPDFLLKTDRGGYDGRGQLRVKAAENTALPGWKNEAIAESAIAFDTEVSLVGARGRDGQCVFYHLTENYHRQGVLTVSLNQPERFAALQPAAEAMLTKLMTHLDYVGVMAMECFLVGDQLLINELAPRVHNSGHWTQDGAAICQFELHLRALLGWPMPKPHERGTTAMVNLLGMEHQKEWLTVPGARLYWYNKVCQPGRKMGHINLQHPDPKVIAQWLRTLPLPKEYDASREWALERLTS
ncbi:ATP-grasp domain-containing protein [Marinimicrobium sp. ABcell2]|uniref:ATP-grasp domain-containing protein n=1 Tax=Marinimicrobium sp. ABcell2 TaxID=3069751 RepID=UPI0027B79627|nr:ATP-grasp domain-containing protein [Marinimicrobium sp. ABcell2]MDQ2077815.1 ATP-grasp domain-containing protein [Marinimicrobium sp. ABcell2]